MTAHSPLILTGCVRSGTTALQRVLLHHPEIGLTNELQSFLGLSRPMGLGYLRLVVSRGARSRNRRGIFRSGDSSRASDLWRSLRFAARMAPGLRRPLTPDRVERAYRALYPHARVVGDKSPSYVGRLDHVLGHDVACLVIYRDGRDVVTSTREATRTIWKNMPHVRNLDTVEKIAKRWVNAIEAMERHRERVVAVRYEDLVAKPEQELRSIAQWLGIDVSGMRADLLHEASVGRYRSDLDPTDLQTVMDLAGPTLARLGYV